jgi:hypothetical protein
MMSKTFTFDIVYDSYYVQLQQHIKPNMEVWKLEEVFQIYGMVKLQEES